MEYIQRYGLTDAARQYFEPKTSKQNHNEDTQVIDAANKNTQFAISFSGSAQ